jgi:hypothetical protein
MTRQLSGLNILGIGVTLGSVVVLGSAISDRNIVYQEHLRRQPQLTQESILESRKLADNDFRTKGQIYGGVAAACIGVGLALYKDEEERTEEERKQPTR